MGPTTRRWVFAASVVALGLVAAQALGLILPLGSPTLFAPFPMLIGIPLLVAELPMRFLAIGPTTAALVYAIWSFPVALGQDRPPRRTIWLHRIAAAGSAAWFALGWRYGLKYEGLVYTLVSLLIGIAVVVVLEKMSRDLAKVPSWRNNLVYHWLLFAWLFSFAFPWLGETI